MDKYIQGTSLYIRNLDDTIDDERLRKEFSVFGIVTSAKVMTEFGRSKGYGFVSFATAEQASIAMKQMNGRFIGPLPIYVALAHRREDRKAFMAAYEAAMNAARSNQSESLNHPSTATQECEELEATVKSIKDWWPDETYSRLEHTADNNIGSGGATETVTNGNLTPSEPQVYHNQGLPISEQGLFTNTAYKTDKESSVQQLPQANQNSTVPDINDLVIWPRLNSHRHYRSKSQVCHNERLPTSGQGLSMSTPYKTDNGSSVQEFPQAKQNSTTDDKNDFVTRPRLNSHQSLDRFGNPLSTGNILYNYQKPIHMPNSSIKVATRSNTQPRPITNKKLAVRPGCSPAGEHTSDLNRMLPTGIIDELGLLDFSYDENNTTNNSGNDTMPTPINQPPLSAKQESNCMQSYYGQYSWANQDTSFLKFLENMELLNMQKNSSNNTIYGTQSRSVTYQGPSNREQYFLDTPSFMMTDRPIERHRPLFNRQPMQGFPPNNPAFVGQPTNFNVPCHVPNREQNFSFGPQGFVMPKGYNPVTESLRNLMSLHRSQQSFVKPSNCNTMPDGTEAAGGPMPNEVPPFHVPIFPVPEGHLVMPPNCGNVMGSTPNQQFFVPIIPPPISGQNIIVPPRHGAKVGSFTYPDPSTIPELLQNGQGLIMNAEEVTVLSNEELTKILETNRLMNHELVNSQQFPGAGQGVGMNNDNFTFPRSTASQSSGVQVIPLVAQGVVLTERNRTVSYQFNPNVRNAPRSYCLWQPADSKDILTEKMLSALEPNQRRELLGDRLFPIVCGMNSDMPEKITMMLLELSDARLLHFLVHVDCLRDKVNEAVAIIRRQQAKEAEDKSKK